MPQLRERLIERYVQSGKEGGVDLGDRKVKVAVDHHTTPGMAQVGGEPYARWRALVEDLGRTQVQGWIDDATEPFFNPFENPEAHAVFLYRNPFDHFLSRSFEQWHVPLDFSAIWPARMDFLKEETEPTTAGFARHFRRSRALDAFIVHVMPTHYVGQRFPDRVAFVKFQEILNAPETVFRRILRMGGIDVDNDPEVAAALTAALALSAKDKMRAYEKYLGTAISSREHSSHMAERPDYVWQNCFSPEDIAWARGRLAEFGLPEELLT